MQFFNNYREAILHAAENDRYLFENAGSSTVQFMCPDSDEEIQMCRKQPWRYLPRFNPHNWNCENCKLELILRAVDAVFVHKDGLQRHCLNSIAVAEPNTKD